MLIMFYTVFYSSVYPPSSIFVLTCRQRFRLFTCELCFFAKEYKLNPFCKHCVLILRRVYCIRHLKSRIQFPRIRIFLKKNERLSLKFRFNTSVTSKNNLLPWWCKSFCVTINFHILCCNLRNITNRRQSSIFSVLCKYFGDQIHIYLHI